MKTKILLAGLGLALASCESMDLVPDSQGNTASWYTTETELQLAANELYILGYWQEPLNSAEQWSDNTTYRLVNRNPKQRNGARRHTQRSTIRGLCPVAAELQAHCPLQHYAREHP